MSPEITYLHQLLADNCFSLTKPRLAVFECLSGHEPQTMAEIVQRTSSVANRASVYRTIAVFEQLAVVKRLNIGWKYKLELNDGFMHHHHHLTCTSCGQVFPLEDNPEFEKQITALAHKQNFKPTDHQLEIRGLCARCQKS